MKKLLLTLGAVAAIAAPVASVIACGGSAENTNPPAETNNSWKADGGTYTEVKTGYDIEVTRTDKKVMHYYVADWTIDGLKTAFEDATWDTNSFHNAFDFYKMGDAKPTKTVEDFIKLFKTSVKLDVLTGMTNTDQNTYKISKVTDGAQFVLDAYPDVVLYAAGKTKPASADAAKATTGSTLTSTKTLAELKKADGGDFSNSSVAAVAKAFGITISSLKGSTIVSGIDFSSVDENDIELTITTGKAVTDDVKDVVFKITPKA